MLLIRGEKVGQSGRRPGWGGGGGTLGETVIEKRDSTLPFSESTGSCSLPASLATVCLYALTQRQATNVKAVNPRGGREVGFLYLSSIIPKDNF